MSLINHILYGVIKVNTTFYKRLINVALGKGHIDIFIKNGNIVDVNTSSILRGWNIGIYGGRICYMGEETLDIVGENTKVVDVKGKFILPGFIDAHTHLDSIFSVATFAPWTISHGNTTVITEMAMIANPTGMVGVKAFMREAKATKLRTFFLAPPLTPPFPDAESSKGLSLEDVKELLRQEDVVGIGEIYWPRALSEDNDRVIEQNLFALNLKKSVEGHGSGARGLKLMAYTLSGARSCHEAITGKEALERLRYGLTLMIRQGYIRKELEAIAPVIKDIHDTRNVCMVSDIFSPEELIEKGGMDEILREAVSLGIEPLKAVQMVTINPARHFGLQEIGSISIGKVADMVMVDSLKDFNCREVYIGGELVAKDGRYLLKENTPHYPEELFHSIEVLPIDKDVLEVYSSDPRKVRLVEIVNETITREATAFLIPKNRRLVSNPEEDIVKAAVFQRHGKNKRPSIGFVRGTGLKKGAFATSLIWDTNNILVIGENDQDMVTAFNRLIELGGGFVVCKGDIIGEFPMPVGGIISMNSLVDIVAAIRKVERATHKLGIKLKRPFLAFQTFSFTGLPFLRLTDKGLFDVKRGKLVSLFIS